MFILIFLNSRTYLKAIRTHPPLEEGEGLSSREAGGFLFLWLTRIGLRSPQYEPSPWLSELLPNSVPIKQNIE